MRVIVVTRIFPNAAAPKAAPYIRQQCTALSALCDVEVFAALPWFPGERWVERHARHGVAPAGVPRQEVIGGVPVVHPRALRIPRQTTLNCLAYAASIAPLVAARARQSNAILAIWAYPDGAAAIALGRLLGIPTFVEAIGSDLNVTANTLGPRLQLQALLPRADGVITVSRALAQVAIACGSKPERTHVIPTGIDRRLFQPRDCGEARKELGLPQKGWMLLFVGRVEPAKGIGELLAGFRKLATRNRSYHLAIVGDGPSRGACEALRDELPGRVTLVGEVSVDEVARWIAASSLLVLPSYREGTPNVVLEALASGRRVVATNVGGIPDVVHSPSLGQLIAPRCVDELVEAIERACEEVYDPEEVAHASNLIDWEENARRIFAVIEGGVRRAAG